MKHEANVARPGHGERQELHGGTNSDPAIVLIDRNHEAAELPLVGDGRPVIDDRAQERTAKRSDRLSPGASRRRM